MMKYFVDADGNYIGCFSEGNIAIPEGSIEVPTNPEYGSQVWDFQNLVWKYKKSQLIDYLAEYRYEKEIGGIMLGDFPIPTDDRSKTLIVGAYNKAIQENNPLALKTFKINGIFAQITNENIIQIGLAVASHVQRCFDAEAIVWQDIHDDLLTTKAQVASTFDEEYNNL